MKELTVIIASLLLFSLNGPAQSGEANSWLSFVIQAEGRPGGNTSWDQVQRLEVSKRLGASAGPENTAGAIRFAPEDKEVRFTFSNFTLNGAWFTPSEISVEYEEDGRLIGPVKALPNAGAGDFFQMSLRFREKTARSLLSIRMSGRASGRFIKDTVSTLLVWGSGDAEPANVQVSYLDTYNRELAARSPYAGATSSYGATQGRIASGTEAYAIQLGAFNSIPDGRLFSPAAAYGTVYSRRIGSQYYVRVGTYNDAVLAKQYLERIRNAFPEAYLVVEDGAPPSTTAPSAGTYYNTNPYGQPSLYGTETTARLPSGNTVAPRAATAYELPPGITGYAVQLASYAQEDNAIDFVNRLRQRGLSDVYVWKKDGNNRVVIAPFPNKGGAANYLETLKRQYSQDGIVTYINE